jgi:hypothetical protein
MREAREAFAPGSSEGEWLLADAKQRVQKQQPGEALQRVLEARGVHMSTEDAARLSASLLGLIQRGLIVRKSRV